MAKPQLARGDRPPIRFEFLWLAALLVAILATLFYRSGLSEYVLASNDGPLGAISSAAAAFPSCLTGIWQDLNWIGNRQPGPSPSVSAALGALVGPLVFSKVYAPFALLFLGCGAWFCFKRLGLSPYACALGALAAMLNSGFFSTACWGVASQVITAGAFFFAIGLVAGPESKPRWIVFPLAGLAVGMGVMEGYDIGALYSLCFSAFVLYVALTQGDSLVAATVKGVGRVAVVAACAGLVAAQTVSGLISTQIQGVVGMGQDTESKVRRWDEATQWSLPKIETLSLVVPGLFGYRMDTPDGGGYWGAVGRDAAWDRFFAGGQQGPAPNPNFQFIRNSGGGSYAGVLVGLIAVWAGLQSLRKEKSVFSPGNRKFIWFWLATAIVCVLLAFGRFAPFYQLLYALPYFSTIRNPAKFIHIFEFSIVMLFAFGIHGLSRLYLEVPAAGFARLTDHLNTWWAKVAGFDRKWTIGCGVAVGFSLLGWLIYSSSRGDLEAHLQTVLFGSDAAKAIAGFSIREAGGFVLWLALAVGAVTLVLSGVLAGPRAKWGAALLGLVLVLDLARANQPWIIYWNYPEKYASNPVIDLLRDRPYEHRVTVLPWWLPRVFKIPQPLAEAEQFFDSVYGGEWKQQLFQYYGVQTLDIVMMPRMPEDMAAFEGALQFLGNPETLPRVTRHWELTNTRYLLGAAGYLDLLNQGIDPAQRRFRVATRFDVVLKPGVSKLTRYEELTAVLSTNGTYALFEFTGALPRAKLYSDWLVPTNDAAALEKLVSPSFDPSQTVLVAGELPPAPATSSTNSAAGTVAFASYAPKHIVLKTQAETPSVLLLNDKYDPNWQVTVDDQPAPLLRCNYIARGVYLKPGPHTVEFQFQLPTGTLKISLAAIAVGIALCGVLVFFGNKTGADQESNGSDVTKSARPQ